MKREVCKKSCCWSPLGVCYYKRECACHPESSRERQRREFLAGLKVS